MSHCVWELASEASILAWRFSSNPREVAAESLMEPTLSVHANPPEIEMKIKLVHKTVSLKTREQSLRWHSHSKIHLDPFHLTRIWCLLNESRVQPLADRKSEKTIMFWNIITNHIKQTNKKTNKKHNVVHASSLCLLHCPRLVNFPTGRSQIRPPFVERPHPQGCSLRRSDQVLKTYLQAKTHKHNF